MIKKYTEEYKNTIIELYIFRKTLAKLNSVYCLSKSMVLTWVRETKLVSVNNKTITQADYQAMLKKMGRIEEENKILKRL